MRGKIQTRNCKIAMGGFKGRAGETSGIKTTLLGAVMIIAGSALALSPFFYTPYQRTQNARGLKGLSPPMVTGEEVNLPPAPPLREDVADVLELSPSGEGLLVIPALKIRVRVGCGVSRADLRAGPGFYPQSQHPELGNVCIAGHRLTCGDWFRDLDKLQPGDELILCYEGKLYTYQVQDVFITANNDWSVIEPTPQPAITLTTCHPPGLHSERLIVRGLYAAQIN